MKNLLTLTFIMGFALAQAQTLESIFKEYIQPSSSTTELRQGLEKLETFCSSNTHDKCTKAKASALYLLADDYYEVVHQLLQVDPELSKPISLKANTLYEKAYALMPIEDFPESQKRMLLEYKLLLEN